MTINTIEFAAIRLYTLVTSLFNFILQYRQALRLQAGHRFQIRTLAKNALAEKREASKDLPMDEVEDVFHTITQSDIDIEKTRTKKKIV